MGSTPSGAALLGRQRFETASRVELAVRCCLFGISKRSGVLCNRAGAQTMMPGSGLSSDDMSHPGQLYGVEIAWLARATRRRGGERERPDQRVPA
jgi:hypothetical protein